MSCPDLQTRETERWQPLPPSLSQLDFLKKWKSGKVEKKQTGRRIMKFLCVAGGGLIAAPNDDIVYEIQIHTSSRTYGLLDMKIGYAVHLESLVAIILHPIPGNVRDVVPKIDVSDMAFVHGLWIDDGIHLYDMPTSSMQRDIRVLTPTSASVYTLYKLGNILLVDGKGKIIVGDLCITYRGDGNAPPDPSCRRKLTNIIGQCSGKQIHSQSPKAVDADVSASPATVDAFVHPSVSAPLPVSNPTPDPSAGVVADAAATPPPVADAPHVTDLSAVTTAADIPSTVLPSKIFQSTMQASGATKKAINKKALPRLPHAKRNIGKVTVADQARGIAPTTFSKGNIGTLLIAFSNKVAPGAVLFERNIYQGRPSKMCMTLQNQGKHKKLNSWSDLLDWLQSFQSLDFFAEMRTNCMDYLSPSDLPHGLAQTVLPITPVASSSTTYGEEANLLFGSDSDDSDKDNADDSDAN